MDWYGWLLIAVAFNWVGAYAGSWLIYGWLTLSGDIKLEGWIWWRGWFPVARFRLISTKSWFARLWDRWYGHAMFGGMIHRDEVGMHDDRWVETTIVHELQHNLQALCFGLLQGVAYGIHYVWLEAHGQDGYWLNVMEVDARKAADRWVLLGRPRIFDFGERR